jgi:hypothetical protein
MKVIHKFGPINAMTTVLVHGRPVHIDKQDEFGGEQVYIWCEVDTSKTDYYINTYAVRCIPTGFQTYEFNEEYFGTVVMSSGLVWHALIKSLR